MPSDGKESDKGCRIAALFWRGDFGRMISMLLQVWRRVVSLLCRPARAGILLGLAGLFIGSVAAAPSDYVVNVWGPDDDLPSSTVTSVVRTPDGYLWVGTYEGLARFDGVRFVT